MSTFESLTGKLSPQSMLAQRYLIVQLAGRGGMSAVYQALDMKRERQKVAIKEMSQESLNEQERADAMTRFQQEAHLLSALRHPNMPQIYDAFGSHGRSFLVMDFIEGKTLLELLQGTRQPLPVDQVLHYADQLCDVLMYLHQQHPPIIFRDLKPTNVMATPSGHVYLIDFGIARFFKEGKPQDTVMLGSPGYAPPEQHGSGQTDPRSDLYALGATLHCCLSNRDPYHSIDRFTFAPVRQFNPQVPLALDQLIQRLLSLDANKRPGSALEVKQALAQIRQQVREKQSSGHIPAMPAPSSAPTQYVAPPKPAYQSTQPALGQAGAQGKLILNAPPASDIQPPVTPGSQGQAYPMHHPTQRVEQHAPHTPFWTPGFLLAFFLLLALTVGGSLLAFNIPQPYGPNNLAGLDHATEAALALLALVLCLIARVKVRGMLAVLVLLLNVLACLGLGVAFLQQTLNDLGLAIPSSIQLSPTQISQILTVELLVAGISLLLWLLRQSLSRENRIWLILFGGGVCACAFLQTPFFDGDVSKHLLLLGALIIFMQGLLIARQVGQQRQGI